MPTLLAAATALDEATEWLSALLAISAAAVYVAGTALEQKGHLEVLEDSAAEPGRSAGLRAVLRNRAWWASLVVLGVGFGLHTLALSMGSLAVVQPLLVTEMVFMVPAGAWVTGAAVTRRDWLGAGAVAIGLVFFLVGTQPSQGSSSVDDAGGWVVAFAWTAGISAVLALVSWRAALYRAALLGACAGVLYGLQGPVLKQATDELAHISLADVATWWAIPSLAAINLVGFLAQNVALRSGRLSAAMSTMTLATPVVSVVIGISLFGESLSTDPLPVLAAIVGVAAATYGVLVLAASPALLAVAGDEPAEGR